MKSLSKILLSLSVLSFAACSAGGPDNKASDAQISSGIVGGTDVPAGHPITRHVVALVMVTQKGTGICTGTLLENNLVLTAAHCVPEKSRLFVVFNRADVFNSPKELVRPVDNAAVSPLWRGNGNSATNTGDIAILHYAGTTPETHKPLPILPANRQGILREGTLVLLAGFGVNQVINGQRSGSGTLRMVSARLAQGRFSQTEILIDQTQGKGACKGDSGGPAIVFLGGQAYVWGVTSRAVKDPNVECTQFAAYTNAAAYEAWVQKTSQALINQANGGRNNPLNGL